MVERPPNTQAVRYLRERAIDFTTHLYRYEDGSGAVGAAELLGVPSEQVVKTLIMETEQGEPLCVLMHGDSSVSTKALARHLGVKSVRTSDPAVAEKRTGYRVGGTSPFGLRSPMPIFVQASILDHERVYINGGKRGFLMGLATADLVGQLDCTTVEVRA